MMKRLSLFVVCVLLVAVVPSSFAQVDTALVDTIANAFQNTLAVSSLHVEAQSLTSVEGGQQGMGGGQQQGSASYDLAQGQSGWNISGSRTTRTQFGDMQFESTIQTIVLDGVVYANLDGMGQMPMGGNNAQAVPQGWFEVTAETGDAGPSLAFVGDSAALMSEALGGLQYPIEASAITAIAELPVDTINEQAMKVYQITLDAATLMDSLGADMILPTRGGGMMPQGGNFTPPADGQMPPMPEGTFQPPADGQFPGGQPPADAQAFVLDPANIQINIAVYIGETDGLVHRIYSVISNSTTIDAETQVTTTLTSISDFSAFNTPITISAPTLGA